MVKVTVVFPRTIDGQRIDVIEFSRVPCVGEYVSLNDTDADYCVRNVSHRANAGANKTVAQINI